MPDQTASLFEDGLLADKIKRRLPHLFHYAERDSSRAGKVGMEVGSLRERILVSLLIHKFGRSNIQTDIPITEHEVDVRILGESLSIKTLTTRTIGAGAVKAIWTVDREQAMRFVSGFEPRCDYLIAHIVWGARGGLYFIPVAAQQQVFANLGRGSYFKLPKPGTNPRGVEIAPMAISMLFEHPSTKKIQIDWRRPSGEYDQYERWIEYWRLD